MDGKWGKLWAVLWAPMAAWGWLWTAVLRLKSRLRGTKGYVYGTAGPNKQPARKHLASGRVEFAIWKAGEQGHTADYWVAFNPYWWPTFAELSPEHTP